MKNTQLFTETQRFNLSWLWAILSLANLLMVGKIIFEISMGETYLLDVYRLIVVFILSVLLIIFFYNLRLDTHIKEDGIYFRFFPFHLNFKKYSWDAVKQSLVRKYNPKKEFDGWGIRKTENKMAYSVSGNRGVQLLLEDGSTILIGTNKHRQVKECLRQLGCLAR